MRKQGGVDETEKKKRALVKVRGDALLSQVDPVWMQGITLLGCLEFIRKGELVSHHVIIGGVFLFVVRKAIPILSTYHHLRELIVIQGGIDGSN